MKWKADWHGIQLLAETDEDMGILKELQDRLPAKAETWYEDGSLHVSLGSDDTRKDVPGDEIVMIMEFHR